MARPKQGVHSAEQIAAAIGVSVTTWNSYLRSGAPKPRRTETLAKFLPRFHRWKVENRRPVGRPPRSDDGEEPAPDTEQHWAREYRKAKAQLAKLDLKVREGDLVDRNEVISFAARACLNVRNSLNAVVRTMGLRLLHAPDESYIEQQLQREFDTILAQFEKGLDQCTEGKPHEDESPDDAEGAAGGDGAAPAGA